VIGLKYDEPHNINVSSHTSYCPVLYNHESLLKIFDCEIASIFPILQFVRKNHYIEDEKNAHCLSYIQYYDNSIKRDTVVLTVDQNMDKKLKA